MDSPRSASQSCAFRLNRPSLYLASFVVAVSLASLAYCYHAGIHNLHYDGVAHLNIARRIFDHVTPKYSHLGTIWLPLQHLLLLPLVQSDLLWSAGLAGSLISVLSFWLATYYLFRLGKSVFKEQWASLLATLAFVLNPNLLYLQTTALGEMLYVALFLGFIFFLERVTHSPSSSAVYCLATFAALASLSRYDGWILVIWGGIVLLWIDLRRQSRVSAFLPMLGRYLVVAPWGGILWLIYNKRAFGDPLSFLKGEYSTKARIGQIIAESGMSHYPPQHSIWNASLYYLDAVLFTSGLALLVLGSLGFLLYSLKNFKDSKFLASGFLFLFPPIFYVYHLFTGSGIIYVPSQPPFGVLNVRYTAIFLPALCFFLPASALAISEMSNRVAKFFMVRRESPHWISGRQRLLVCLLTLSYIGLQYLWQLRNGGQGVVFYQEAYVNGFERKKTSYDAAEYFGQNYDGRRILMDLSHHGIISQRALIPLVHFLSDTNPGRFEAAVSQPSAWVNWVVVQPGDAVWRFSLNFDDLKKHFDLVFETEGLLEQPLKIYRKRD